MSTKRKSSALEEDVEDPVHLYQTLNPEDFHHSEDFSAIMTEVASIKGELSSVKKELTYVKKELASVKTELRHQSKLLLKNENTVAKTFVGTITDTWSNTFGVEFPLKDLDTLYKVENELSTKPELKKILSSSMTVMMDTGETLQKNVTAVMKKLVSRELAIKFTATRKMADKIVFATNVSNIYHCILDFLCASLQKSESKVASAIGTAFTHSQYWDGNRNKCLKTENTEEK